MPRVVPLKRTVEKAQIWNRYAEPTFFKFYGTYRKTKLSQPEHFEFSVIVSKRTKHRAMYFLVRTTFGRMIHDHELPPEVDYKAYDGFMQLFGEDWQKIDKVMYYDIQHGRT